MKTQVLGTDTAEELAVAVTTAVRLLREGAVVALPTETVYGLAADALSVDAALRIFEAKERPRFDPLIVHLPDLTWLDRVTQIEPAQSQLVRALAERFWPGPLTFVLTRSAIVPDVVTAGLNTVAVRMSAHPVFAAIVSAFGSPLAAPSANRFGRISPTAASHVAAELDTRISLIVDAGATTFGIESTIIAIRRNTIEILRRGPVTSEQLSEYAHVEIADAGAKMRAPGQLPSHYAPRTPLVLTSDLATFALPSGKRVGALGWRGLVPTSFAEVRTLSTTGDFHEAAANLFRHLRELDDAQLDLIVAETLPEHGLGSAIMDRLRRAAA